MSRVRNTATTRLREKAILALARFGLAAQLARTPMAREVAVTFRGTGLSDQTRPDQLPPLL